MKKGDLGGFENLQGERIYGKRYMACRTLNGVDLDLQWKADKTLADSYPDTRKAEILAALKQAQGEEALDVLR